MDISKPIAADHGRNLATDYADALRWREVGYSLPAYKADNSKLTPWSDGWPAAVRLAAHYKDEVKRLRGVLSAIYQQADNDAYNESPLAAALAFEVRQIVEGALDA